MPNWAYSCCLYAPFVKSEDLAMAILGVVESTKTKQDPPQYILEVLDRLKIKAPTFLKKARPSLNYEKL